MSRDLKGCEWGFVIGFGDEDLAGLSRNMVTLYAMPPGQLPTLLGSGFIILRESGKALCITASHVVEDARRALGLPARRASSAAPGFGIGLIDGEFLKGPCARGEIVAHVAIDDKDDFAKITEAACGPHDVGILVLTSKLFANQPVLAINSDIFDPGTAVMVLGTQETKVEDGGRASEGRTIVLQKTLQARYGTIRKIHRRDRLLKTLVYELTLSIPHGMSGGPVLLAPEKGRGMQVIAFASYDHAPPETVDDCRVPGAGTAIPMGSAFIAAAACGNSIPLLQFVRQQRVRDLGSLWPDLEIVDDGRRVQFRRLSGIPLPILPPPEPPET
jgi:hypothetical protein